MFTIKLNQNVFTRCQKNHTQSNCVSTIKPNPTASTIKPNQTVCLPSNPIKLYIYHQTQSNCVSTIKPNQTVCLPSNPIKLCVSTIKPNQTVCLPSNQIISSCVFTIKPNQNVFTRCQKNHTQSNCASTIKPNQTVCLPSNPIKLYIYHQTQLSTIKPNQTVHLPSNPIKLCVYHQTQSNYQNLQRQLKSLQAEMTDMSDQAEELLTSTDPSNHDLVEDCLTSLGGRLQLLSESAQGQADDLHGAERDWRQYQDDVKALKARLQDTQKLLLVQTPHGSSLDTMVENNQVRARSLLGADLMMAGTVE